MAQRVRGLITPFVRDKKRDFASGEGWTLTMSKSRQVLGTRPGEVPWRTEFGTELDRLRHQQNTNVARELGRLYTKDALRKFVPSVSVTGFSAVQDGERLSVRVTLNDGASDRSVEVTR
jgi:uncharacterized protein